MNKFYHAGKTRLYSVKHKESGEVFKFDKHFEPMSHGEACTFISKMMVPSQYILYEVVTL